MTNRIAYIARDFEFPVTRQNADKTPVTASADDRFTYRVSQGTATPVIELTGLEWADLDTARIDIAVLAADMNFAPGYYTEELIQTNTGADVVFRTGLEVVAEGYSRDTVMGGVIVRGQSIILETRGATGAAGADGATPASVFIMSQQPGATAAERWTAALAKVAAATGGRIVFDQDETFATVPDGITAAHSGLVVEGTHPGIAISPDAALASSVRFFNVNGATDVTFRGITFNGSGKFTTAVITVQSGSTGFTANGVIINGGDTALTASACLELRAGDAMVDNCRFSNLGQGVRVSPGSSLQERVSVRQSRFDNISSRGFNLQTSSGRRVSSWTLVCGVFTALAADCQPVRIDAAGGTVDFGMICENRITATGLVPGSSDTISLNNGVTDTVISENIGENDSDVFINVAGGCKRIVITNNEIKGVHNVPINVGGDADATDANTDITIVGNQGRNGVLWGVRLMRVLRCAVTGNQMSVSTAAEVFEAHGTLPGRSAYDAQPAKFRYFIDGTGDASGLGGTYSEKNSATPGDWSTAKTWTPYGLSMKDAHAVTDRANTWHNFSAPVAVQDGGGETSTFWQFEGTWAGQPNMAAGAPAGKSQLYDSTAAAFKKWNGTAWVKDAPPTRWYGEFTAAGVLSNGENISGNAVVSGTSVYTITLSKALPSTSVLVRFQNRTAASRIATITVDSTTQITVTTYSSGTTQATCVFSIEVMA